MTRMRLVKPLLGSLLALGFGLAPLGASAAPPVPPPGVDLLLYELTENMRLKGKKLVRRTAVAALAGSVRAGTPLCPTALGVDFCTVTGTGADNVNLSTGTGPVWGDLAVVVQDDNPVDGPEFVVMTARFSGTIDLSQAVLSGIPIGTIVGKLKIKGGGEVPFSGVFRLPFDLGFGPVYLVPGAGAPCSFDLCPVESNELALDTPTVRFEITFP